MKYKVIEAEEIQELIQKVNEAIQQGWEPIGGIDSRLGIGSAFHQAMIKNDR